jgi:hypothetical protein
MVDSAVRLLSYAFFAIALLFAAVAWPRSTTCSSSAWPPRR